MDSIEMHLMNYLLCFATKQTDPSVYLALERLNSQENMDASQTTKILKRLIFLVQIKNDSKIINFAKRFLTHTKVFEEILKNEKSLRKFMNYIDIDKNEKYLLLNYFLAELKKNFSKSYLCQFIQNLNKYIIFLIKRCNEIEEWKTHFFLHILSLTFHKNIQNTIWSSALSDKKKENSLLDFKTYYEGIHQKYVMIYFSYKSNHFYTFYRILIFQKMILNSIMLQLNFLVISSIA